VLSGSRAGTDPAPARDSDRGDARRSSNAERYEYRTGSGTTMRRDREGRSPSKPHVYFTRMPDVSVEHDVRQRARFDSADQPTMLPAESA
jgi:hypothetical protein